MNMTMRVRRWAALGAPMAFVVCYGSACLFCGGWTPDAPWALLLCGPVVVWWGIGAGCLRLIRPIWDAGSSRRLALADRWLLGGLCATAVAGGGMALLCALYSPVTGFPGVLPALAAICAMAAQCMGYIGFCHGRLRVFRRWPGRFRARDISHLPMRDPLATMSIVRPPRGSRSSGVARG